MTRLFLIRLTCLSILLVGMTLQAEEDSTLGATTDGANTTETIGKMKNSQTDPAVNDNSVSREQQDAETELINREPRSNESSSNRQLPNQQPQADNLKNRDLGAAFRSFRPSEEISADNAVPFPVDI